MTEKQDASVRIVMGRLIEIRVASGYRSASEVEAFFEKIGAVFHAHFPDGGKCVTVADWRRCSLLSRDAAQHLLTRMTQNNPLVVRSAAVGSLDSPSAVMQFCRLVRESDNDNRKLFFDPERVQQWLGEVLTATEKARLHTFLEEGAPNGAQPAESAGTGVPMRAIEIGKSPVVSRG
jgi:hypothetical protein